MSLISEIGIHIENERHTYYTDNILNRPQIDEVGNQISRSSHIENCALNYPSAFFSQEPMGFRCRQQQQQTGGVDLSLYLKLNPVRTDILI